jgi:two-component system cell cycle sensor histidine kinase/response regulator CckA
MSADLPITETLPRPTLGSRILVVGGAELAPELRKTILARSYLEHHFAIDAGTAAELARSLKPDLVIVQGVRYEVAVATVRQLQETIPSETTVIVFAPALEPAQEEGLREAGATGVLSQPVDPILIDGRLESIFNVPGRRAVRARGYLRSSYFLSATEAPQPALAVNVSVYGMLLETAASLDVGTKLNVAFRLPDGPEIRAVGQVVRRAGTPDGRPQAGIEFLVLRGDARERIAAFVESTLGTAFTPAATAARHLTERTSWETELRASEMRKAAILDSILDCIVTIDHEGRIIEFNRAAETTFGYSRSEVLGRQAAEVILAPARLDTRVQGLSRLLVAVRAMGERTETVGVRKGGAEFPMELAVTAVPLPRRQIYTATLRDITDRKLADEAVRTSARQFRALFEGAVDAMVITDREGRYIEVNRAACVLYGMMREELRGHWIGDFAEGGFDFDAAMRTLENERTVRGDFRIVRSDRTGRDVEFVATADFLPGNHLVVLRDITDRRLLESEFRQAQKMEAVGRLAGGVAHDFNNLLNVIRGFTELTLRGLPPDDPQRRRLQEILKATERASSLTGQLLAFSRKQVLQPRVFDLNGVVSDVEKMLEPLIGEDVDLLIDLDLGLGRVRADRGQIEQVLMNLLVNARDAMPEGGKITVTTRDADLDEGSAREHPGARPGRYVLLEVADEGVGMDAEVRRHIFEPFFTTKPTGKGTGLGLATAYGIVKQSDGYVEVETEPGHGTTFRVYLPRVQDAVEGAPRKQGGPAGPARGGTILLVEDQDMLRRVTRELLEEGGYRVLEAGSPEAALEIAEAHESPIDLLLTDVVMPGLSGPDLARRLCSSRPETRVLYISGYTDAAILERGIVADRTAFLHKPFTAVALERKIREVLGGGSEE